MVILLILVFLVPSLISVHLYERFTKHILSLFNRISLLLIFAFLINMGVYAAIWLRGWEYIIWTFDGTSQLASVSFILKYMVLSLLYSVALPFMLSLVKIGKHK